MAVTAAESLNDVLTAAKALDYLADHTRPIGGQEKYNAEHLIDLAEKLRKFVLHSTAEPQEAPDTRAAVIEECATAAENVDDVYRSGLEPEVEELWTRGGREMQYDIAKAIRALAVSRPQSK